MNSTDITKTVELTRRRIGHGWLRLVLVYKYPVIDPESGRTVSEEDLGVSILEEPKTGSQIRMNRMIEKECQAYLLKRTLDISKGVLKHAGYDMVSYYHAVANSKVQNYIAGLRHFEKFVNGYWSFVFVNSSLCENYERYLLKCAKTSTGHNLTPNTIRLYARQFRYAVALAIKDGFVKEFDIDSIPYLSELPEKREILNEEEVTRLLSTPAPSEDILKLVRFIMASGLRVGRAISLKWSEIKTDKFGRHFIFEKRNSSRQFLDENCISIISPRNKEDRIFAGFEYLAAKKQMKIWVKEAGITRNIIFDDFRILSS